MTVTSEPRARARETVEHIVRAVRDGDETRIRTLPADPAAVAHRKVSGPFASQRFHRSGESGQPVHR
ncbi:hypothetical protein [Streptomyces sp. 147326]|uniref:hypothetical protein n=1 Tax=Streptomyces sp. 147326 TaxID=3074379 RepID=UPI003857DCBA